VRAAWERGEQKEKMNMSVRAWERERAKRGDEYVCACVGVREQGEELNITVRAYVGEGEGKKRR